MNQALWDREAVAFDDEPDHGLADAATRAAWRELLLGSVSPAPARIAYLGCGTGTLTRLLVDEGHTVDGVDISPEMIKRARRKVPEAEFVVGDAAYPPLELCAYDVVLSRHVLWALPDPVAAFARWVELLAPNGSVVLIEGHWGNGAGLTAVDAERSCARHGRRSRSGTSPSRSTGARTSTTSAISWSATPDQLPAVCLPVQSMPVAPLAHPLT